MLFKIYYCLLGSPLAPFYLCTEACFEEVVTFACYRADLFQVLYFIFFLVYPPPMYTFPPTAGRSCLRSNLLQYLLPAI